MNYKELALDPHTINQWYSDIKADPEKLQYKEKVFSLLDKMQVGQRFALRDIVRDETADMFVKCVCAYILSFGCGVQFCDDYNSIQKIAVYTTANKSYNNQ